MKLRLLSMSAIVSVMMAASLAHAAAPGDASGSQGLATAGTVDLQLGYRHMTEDDDTTNNSDSHVMAGGNARGSIPFGSMFSAQGDLQMEGFHVSDGDNSTPRSNLMVGGHVSARDPNAWLVGAFAGAALQHSESTYNGWIGGLEAQGYFQDLTVYGQAGWGSIKTDMHPAEGFNVSYFWRGVGRYFIHDDTKIQAEVSAAHVDAYIDGNNDGSFWNWSLSGETRLPVSMPLYGTLEYRGGHYHTDDGPDTARDDAVLAGVSFHFGANSLKHNDRYGATLDLPMLPVRASAWTESID